MHIWFIAYVMPVPPKYFDQLMSELAIALRPVIDRAWDDGGRAAVARINHALRILPPVVSGRLEVKLDPTTSVGAGVISAGTGAASGSGHAGAVSSELSPQKRGAQNREPKGVVKSAVKSIIFRHPNGVSREEIRRESVTYLGKTIKEGSLRQALRLLRLAGDINNKDRLWYPNLLNEPIDG